VTAKTTTKTTDTASKPARKRPAPAAKVVETEPTTVAASNPFAGLFDGMDAIVRNATAPATGSGHKGRQRNYSDNPLTIDELIKWGTMRGRAISFKNVSDELRTAVGGNVEAAIATAFETGSFDSFSQPLHSTTVESAIAAVRDAIEAVTNSDRAQYVTANLAAFDEAYNRNDDVSDPYNPVYGRQSVARWALSSLGATDVVVHDDMSATVTVDPLAMFFSRSGAKNISAPMSAVFQNMNTAQGSANLALVMDAASEEQKRTLAICMGTYLRAAATAASGELADKLAHAATVAPTIVVNAIYDDVERSKAVAALEVAVA